MVSQNVSKGLQDQTVKQPASGCLSAMTGSTVLHKYIIFMNGHVDFKLVLRRIAVPEAVHVVPVGKKKRPAVPIVDTHPKPWHWEDVPL